MRILIVRSILVFWLVIFFTSIANSDTGPQVSIDEAALKVVAGGKVLALSLETSVKPRIVDDTGAAPSKTSSKPFIEENKELVVVSKTPEFFSYTLSGISVLLSAITILIGIISGVGLTIVVKTHGERKKLESIRRSFDQEQKTAIENLKNDYKQMTEALKRTAFRAASFHASKRDLRNKLAESEPAPSDVYLLIEKTIRYPDLECLTLYSDALKMFETNINIVRIVRNGIMQFSRSPEMGDIYNLVD